MRIEHGISGGDTDKKITATIRGQGPVPKEFALAMRDLSKVVRITYGVTEIKSSMAGEGSYEIIMEATGAPEVI